MKKILIIMIALLPLAAVAGNGDKKNSKKDVKIDIHINTGKDGKVVISGLKDKELEKNINDALKDVKINVTDGKEKHTIHFKAELNID